MARNLHEDGTIVPEGEMYEFPNWNDEAVCCDCGETMVVPEMGECDGFEEPFFRRSEHYEPVPDQFHALCETCYSKAVSEILEK